MRQTIMRTADTPSAHARQWDARWTVLPSITAFRLRGRHPNLSKATVSDQVQALENAIGVRLLNRTTRRVSLTEIGRGYYELCVQILQDLAEVDEAAGAQKPRKDGAGALVP